MKQDTEDSINAYAKSGIRPGHFIEAVIKGDLFEAYARADAENTRDMHEIVQYVYNHVPVICRAGRSQSNIVEKWCEARGIEGYMAMNAEERQAWIETVS